MKSILSLKLVLLLFVSFLILSGLFIFSLFIVFKAVTNPNAVGIVIGLVLLWFSSGLFLMLSKRIKIIKIDTENISIRELFSFKTRVYKLSEIVYEDFKFETIYGITKGILIRLDTNISVTVSDKEYTNSDMIISSIKNKCSRESNLKVESWSRELKIFLLIGFILLLTFIMSMLQFPVERRL